MEIRKLLGKTIVRKRDCIHGTIRNIDCYEHLVDIWDEDLYGYYNFSWEEIEKAIEGKKFVNDYGESYIVII